MNNLTRRHFIQHTAAAATACALPAGCTHSLQTRHVQPPNLLFVYADQMRAMAMSCAGDPNLHTPNMDRLAAEGARFTRMYTPAPLCSPARASLMTGLMPHNAGVTGNNMHLREDVPAIAEITSAAGYATGHVGKWHLHGGYLPGSASEYAFVPPEHHRGFAYWAAFEHGHKYFGSRYYRDTPEPIVLPPDAYEPDVQTDLAIEFIESHRAVPWHLDLSWGPPHFPLEQVKPADLARHDPERIRLRPNVPAEFHDAARQDLARYYALIENLDANLGRLLAKLDAANLARNTIVVFTSDHGDMMRSHGWQYKRRPQEESSRVPYLIRYPARIRPGRTVDALASLVDSLPTLLGLMNLPAPPTDGLNFAPALTERGRTPTRQWLHMQCPQLGCRNTDPPPFARAPWRAIVTNRHKAAFLKTGPQHMQLIQLYDLESDPHEMQNIANTPEYKQTQTRLTALFHESLTATRDTQFQNLTLLESSS